MARRCRIAIPTWTILSMEDYDKENASMKIQCDACDVFFYDKDSIICDFCLNYEDRHCKNPNKTYILKYCDEKGNIAHDKQCCDYGVKIFLPNDIFGRDDFDFDDCYIKTCTNCENNYYTYLDEGCPICFSKKGEYVNDCFIHKNDNDDLPLRCGKCDARKGIIETKKFTGLCDLEYLFINFYEHHCINCIDSYVSANNDSLEHLFEEKFDFADWSGGKDYDVLSEIKKNTKELEIYCDIFNELINNLPKSAKGNVNKRCLAKTRNGYCSNETKFTFQKYCNEHYYINDYTIEQYNRCTFCKKCSLWTDLKTHKCRI